MSEVDDLECFTKVVQQSEKFLCGEIAKVHKHMKALEGKLNEHEETIKRLKLTEAKLDERDAKVLRLEQQLTSMANENKGLMEEIERSHSNCKTLMRRSFAAALDTALDLPTQPNVMGPVEIRDQVVGPMPPETIPFAHVASTPIATSRPQEQGSQACSVVLGKRKLDQASATSCIYSEMNALPDDLRQRLEPFSKESRSNIRDKLNKVQQAFVRYKVNELKKTGGKCTDIFIEAMIREGEKERIWPKHFKPSPDSFSKYLSQRIKNEKKIVVKEEMLKGTNDRLSALLFDSLQEEDVSATERSEVNMD